MHLKEQKHKHLHGPQETEYGRAIRCNAADSGPLRGLGTTGHSRAWRDRLIFCRSPSQDVGRGTNLRWDRVIYYSGC